MRKVPIKRLEKKLDKLISTFVIERDLHCVICGSISQLGAGHVFSRRHKSTRWNLKNVFCLCWACNFRDVHDNWPYRSWYIKKYGLKAIQNLRKEYEKVKKWTREELENMIKNLI